MKNDYSRPMDVKYDLQSHDWWSYLHRTETRLTASPVAS